MYGIRHILLRKAASAFLLVLLLSIHAIKLLHTHAHESVKTGNNNASDKTAFFKQVSSVCSICQFEFIREATLPDTDIGVRPLFVFSVFKSELNASFYSAPHFYFFHRGPPAI